MIEVIKELADNTKPVKELKTVIDGKAKTFSLEGKILVILTYAKNNNDEELLNRLYKLNIIIKEKTSEANIKEKVKTNSIIDSPNNEIIKRSRLIIQAAIQYLIEKEIIVYVCGNFIKYQYNSVIIKVNKAQINIKIAK